MHDAIDAMQVQEAADCLGADCVPRYVDERKLPELEDVDWGQWKVFLSYKKELSFPLVFCTPPFPPGTQLIATLVATALMHLQHLHQLNLTMPFFFDRAKIVQK